jgi:hypothetical protein
VDAITPKLFNSVAQAGHFAGGAAIVLAVVVAGGHAWWGLAGVAALAALKEFWYDEQYESAEVRGSSLEDFLFYLSGAGAALILAWAKGRL